MVLVAMLVHLTSGHVGREKLWTDPIAKLGRLCRMQFIFTLNINDFSNIKM
jgi:hypothetical protein